MKRLWVIAYDIADDRARQRVDRYLQGWGDRVQYSVFEAYLTPAQARRIAATVTSWLNLETDSLRLYPLCAWCQQSQAVEGQGRRSEDPELIVL